MAHGRLVLVAIIALGGCKEHARKEQARKEDPKPTAPSFSLAPRAREPTSPRDEPNTIRFERITSDPGPPFTYRTLTVTLTDVTYYEKTEGDHPRLEARSPSDESRLRELVRLMTAARVCDVESSRSPPRGEASTELAMRYNDTGCRTELADHDWGANPELAAARRALDAIIGELRPQLKKDTETCGLLVRCCAALRTAHVELGPAVDAMCSHARDDEDGYTCRLPVTTIRDVLAQRAVKVPAACASPGR
jgi:hypothetical protein